MLFVEAINKTMSQPNGKKWLTKNKHRTTDHHQDSVELSSAAHEVKEIYLDSEESTPLTASFSIFANLIEHVLGHIFNDTLHLHSPEELSLDQKKWALFLQVPPSTETNNAKTATYLAPGSDKLATTKQLIFHIPVKPFYGNTLDMIVLVSAHVGSPKPLECFATHPKETTLPILRTPYTPEFLAQQTSHFHIFLDQDGEPDQLSPLYSHVNQSRLIEKNIPSITGLRVWRAKKNILTPAVLGDNRIGLLFIGHYPPLTGSAISEETRTRQANNLYTKV